MSTQSTATSTAEPSVSALFINSGFIAGENPKIPKSTFLWSVETANQLLVRVRYGGGDDTSNLVEVSIPWGDTSSYQIGPGINPKIKVHGQVRVAWANYDPITKRYKTFAVNFSGIMVLAGSDCIASSDQSDHGSKNWILVYAQLE